MGQKMIPPPKNVKKLVRQATHEVADHGVFRVHRLEYPTLPRDIFVFECPDWCNVVAESTEGEIILVWQ